MLANPCLSRKSAERWRRASWKDRASPATAKSPAPQRLMVPGFLLVLEFSPPSEPDVSELDRYAAQARTPDAGAIALGRCGQRAMAPASHAAAHPRAAHLSPTRRHRGRVGSRPVST